MNDNPFYNTRLEEERAKDKRRIITVSLNLEEYAELVENMKLLQQPKDSTALKQLAELGAIVLNDQKTKGILSLLAGNLRKNKRIGIIDVSPELPTYNANVIQKNEDL